MPHLTVYESYPIVSKLRVTLVYLLEAEKDKVMEDACRILLSARKFYLCYSK